MGRWDVAEAAIPDICFALQSEFGNVAFSVRQVSDRVNSTYIIKWMDGPSKGEVQAVALPHIRGVPMAKIRCMRTDRPHAWVVHEK